MRFLKELLLFSEHRVGWAGFDYLRRAAHVIPGVPGLYRKLARTDGVRACDPFLSPRGVTARSGPSGDIRERLIDNMTHWLMNYWLRIDNQNSMGVPARSYVFRFSITASSSSASRYRWGS